MRYIQCLRDIYNVYFWVIYILECFKTETNESIESYKYIGCKKNKHVVFIKYNFFLKCVIKSGFKKYNWIPLYYMIHICICICIYYT